MPPTPADLLDFTGARVLVTGGSSGIGNGIAQAFRARGASVAVWGTRPAPTDYTAEDGDLTGLHYTQTNLADPDAIATAPLPFDGLDVLVQAQGTVRYARQEFERDGWDAVMAVNLDSLMHVARRFHPALAGTRGAMTIIASVSGFQANIGNPAYAASKAGAVSLVKSLAKAWARDGVRVNAIAPGLVPTKLTRVTTDHPGRAAAALAAIPLARMGTPADMAGPALFLASPLAAYITGQTLVVDGGLTL